MCDDSLLRNPVPTRDDCFDFYCFCLVQDERGGSAITYQSSSCHAYMALQHLYQYGLELRVTANNMQG
jgi:hypothetical protein